MVYMVHWAHKSDPNWHLNWFSRFCTVCVCVVCVHDTHTTEHATYVAIGLVYLMHAV